MKYAKLISETSIDTNPPKSAKIGEAYVIGRLPESYLASMGYYPLIEETAPTPESGYHVEFRYKNENNTVVKYWIQVENPPEPQRVRSFSKIKLKIAMATAGVLPEFESFIHEIEVAPGYSAFDAWNDAQIIKDDFNGFDEMLSTIKTTLGVSDEIVNQILSESEV